MKRYQNSGYYYARKEKTENYRRRFDGVNSIHAEHVAGGVERKTVWCNYSNGNKSAKDTCSVRRMRKGSTLVE